MGRDKKYRPSPWSFSTILYCISGFKSISGDQLCNQFRVPIKSGFHHKFIQSDSSIFFCKVQQETTNISNLSSLNVNQMMQTTDVSAEVLIFMLIPLHRKYVSSMMID